MKDYLKYAVWLAFIIMIVANTFIFVSSIRLGEGINGFEKNISRLEYENQRLERSVYKIDSLRYAQSVAPGLNFTVASKPIYLDSPNYALRP